MKSVTELDFETALRSGMTAAELDDLGASHWELVGVVSAVDGVHFYFKRERRR